MLHNIPDDEVFSRMMRIHAEECMSFLFSKSINFSILVDLNMVGFKPSLPEKLLANLKPITMFVLAGYTFESAELNNVILEFKAGFGEDNVEAVVTVPLCAILQIRIEDAPIFINISSCYHEKNLKTQNNTKKSMEALMSNPKNKDLFSK